MTHRLYTKALGNELAITVSTATSDRRYSVPATAQAIADRFGIQLELTEDWQFFRKWSEILDAAEAVATRQEIGAFIVEYLSSAEPTLMQHAIAQIPISNFIDTTLDRSFTKALLAAGRRPLAHDWSRQMVGSWRQTIPETPNVFYMLPQPGYGLWSTLRFPTHEERSIQRINIGDMLDGRDLLLLDYSFPEAEDVLGLAGIALAGEKIVNYTSRESAVEEPWAARGVLIARHEPHVIVGHLVPKTPGTNRYGSMDILIPRTTVLECSAKVAMRSCVISAAMRDLPAGWKRIFVCET